MTEAIPTAVLATTATLQYLKRDLELCNRCSRPVRGGRDHTGHIGLVTLPVDKSQGREHPPIERMRLY